MTETRAKFQKDPGKIIEGLRSQDTQCLYALIEVAKKRLSFNFGKSDKINLRIRAKLHTHL